MIRHIIKLIWNRKRSLAWIFIEQVLVFLALFLCFTYSVDIFMKLFSKGNIKVDNLAVVHYSNYQQEDDIMEESNNTQFRNMLERMKELQIIELVSISNRAVPVMGSNLIDSVDFRENRHRTHIKFCDENFHKMFSLKLSEGEWFRDSDVSEIMPALVTQQFADDVGLTGSAIGQTVEYNGMTYRITGVVEAFKNRANDNLLPVLFVPVSMATNTYRQYVVKYKQGQSSDFTRAFFAEFYRNFPRDQYQPMLIDFSKINSIVSVLDVTIGLYMTVIPVAFLLIFAFMGTFGVVWMQSKKRMSELGLRIALGCTPARLQITIVLENLILTTFAMLPGLIVAAGLYSFSPKGWEWITAVVAAIVIMLLFSAFSAWYPARQAAKVQPVEALRAN